MNETQWQETMNSHVAEEKNKRFFFLSSYAQARDRLKKMVALYDESYLKLFLKLHSSLILLAL